MDKRFLSSLLALLLVAFGATRAASSQDQIGMPAGSIPADTEIGGEKLVVLSRTAVSKTKPEFTSLTLMPGRGMEFLYIAANFPGKGEVQVLASPDLATVEKTLDAPGDPSGQRGVEMGGAFLIPYPNRVRGQLAADGKSLTVPWHGQTLHLPGGHGPKGAPSTEGRASHGLIFLSKAQDIHVSPIPGGQQVTGVIHAGDYGGHWLSNTDLNFTVTLAAEAIDVAIVARNIGRQSEPIAIGWHPYFNLPSGNRAQARVRLPADTYSELDSYQSVIPTGKLLPVKGTKFDLLAAGGTPIGDNHYDDNWTHLLWKSGAATVEITDPAAHYGVDVEARSPAIKAIQLYAPPGKNFVAVEEQYNFIDPFGPQWGATNTGLVTLKPGQSTTWHVRLHVFVP